MESCNRVHLARGFCMNHYRVFMRRGTPTVPPRPERKVFVAKGGYLYRSSKTGSRYLHLEIAEAALGRPLPPEAELHHVDGNPANNAGNLVICPNHEYHMLLHQRQRALERCGHADWRPCKVCGRYADPATMMPQYKQFYHRACKAEEARARRQRVKESKNANSSA